MDFAEYMGMGSALSQLLGRGEKEKRRNGETHNKNQVTTNHVVQCQPNQSAMCRCTLREFAKVLRDAQNEAKKKMGTLSQALEPKIHRQRAISLMWEIFILCFQTPLRQNAVC